MHDASMHRDNQLRGERRREKYALLSYILQGPGYWSTVRVQLQDETSVLFPVGLAERHTGWSNLRFDPNPADAIAVLLHLVLVVHQQSYSLTQLRSTC